MIHCLNPNEISPQDWNRCVFKSSFFRFEALYEYIDAITAGHWMAFVDDNFEHVMPVPISYPYGIRSAYQPFSTQQLGIFGPEQTLKTFIPFYQKLKKKVYRFQIQTPAYHSDSKPEFVSLKTNYILNLRKDIQQLRNEYDENTRRNIKRAYKAGIEIRQTENLTKLISFYRQELGLNTDKVPNSHFIQLENALMALQKMNFMFIKEAWLNGELCGMALFLHYKKYVLYPIGASRKKMGAGIFHFLFDQVIEEWSPKADILDFEGSDIPGVARFFSGLGGEPQPCWVWKGNILSAGNLTFAP